MEFTQASLPSTITPLAKPALPLNTIEAWVSQDRCIWVFVIIARHIALRLSLSCCFAFVIPLHRYLYFHCSCYAPHFLYPNVPN